MIELRDILQVEANDDFSLTCEMENGEVFKYNMAFIKNEKGPMIEPLKDINYFKKVWLDLGALTWPNGFSIHGNTVARDGQLIKKIA